MRTAIPLTTPRTLPRTGATCEPMSDVAEDQQEMVTSADAVYYELRSKEEVMSTTKRAGKRDSYCPPNQKAFFHFISKIVVWRGILGF